MLEETKKSTVEYNVALYDFTGSAADELSFKKGDKIGVTEVISDDWLRGKLGRHEGMFPRAFVRLSKESGRKLCLYTVIFYPWPLRIYAHILISWIAMYHSRARSGAPLEFYLTNRPDFFMVSTLVDYRNDAMKCLIRQS